MHDNTDGGTTDVVVRDPKQRFVVVDRERLKRLTHDLHTAHLFISDLSMQVNGARIYLDELLAEPSEMDSNSRAEPHPQAG